MGKEITSQVKFPNSQGPVPGAVGTGGTSPTSLHVPFDVPLQGSLKPYLQFGHSVHVPFEIPKQPRLNSLTWHTGQTLHPVALSAPAYGHKTLIHQWHSLAVLLPGP